MRPIWEAESIRILESITTLSQEQNTQVDRVFDLIEDYKEDPNAIDKIDKIIDSMQKSSKKHLELYQSTKSLIEAIQSNYDIKKSKN